MAIIKKFRIKSFKQKKTILKLQNVSLSFQKRQILENISFEINQGEIFGMLGPNGVGKSTIFNLVTGLIKPNNGDIIIKDEKVNDYPIFLRTSKPYKTFPTGVNSSLNNGASTRSIKN